MKTGDEKLDVIAKHIRRLNALLDDPHPGLLTWCHMFGEEMQWLADYWAGKKAEEIRHQSRYGN